jgi:hypothetical protein
LLLIAAAPTGCSRPPKPAFRRATLTRYAGCWASSARRSWTRSPPTGPWRARTRAAFASGRGREAAELLLAAGQRLITVDDQLARDVYMTACGVSTWVGQPEILRAVSLAARALPLPPDPRPIDPLLDTLTLLVTDGREAAAALRETAKVLMDIPVDDVVKWGWVATGAAGAVAAELHTEAIEKFEQTSSASPPAGSCATRCRALTRVIA